MKATEATLFSFLQKSAQFIIPIYQRTYSWTHKQCEQLWNDILHVGNNETIDAHFVGSIVYIEKGLYSHSTIPQLLVIDGQQRLTTVTLLIAALSRVIAKQNEPIIAGINARKLANYYLLNAEEDGDLHYKILLTRSDREYLKKVVDAKPINTESNERVALNFNYFSEKLNSLDNNTLNIVYKGLRKLIIVDIGLNREHDNPQLIFESLNSTGLKLSQADLIRNFVLMDLEPKIQSELYEDHWFPLEQSFAKGEANLFDRFMRDYLTLKTSSIPRINDVYDVFKRYVQDSDNNTSSIVIDVHEYGKCYTAFACEDTPDKDIKKVFHDINTLKMDVSYPFLLELFYDYQQNHINKDELINCLILLENYVFRRAICEIPTNSLNKTFANLGKELKKDRYVESLQAALLLKVSYRRYPDDKEFIHALKTRDLYNFRSRSYWLRKIENYQRKEIVNVEEYTIEHILPQNENLSLEWQKELGNEWQTIQATYLHTLGNLTLTAYNSELSDRPFKAKKEMEGGFADSPLRLNKDLGKVLTWNEESILARSEMLAIRAVEVWYYPSLEDDILQAYKPTKTEATDYTIEEHHQYLQSGHIKELFNHFRHHVMSLDESISEVVLKLYIAYKLDTNFVDVVPQKNRLRLSINLPFDEIHDPKGICKDVTNIGRWGNGDVEVGLSSIDQLPYVMELVQQAYEKQLA